MMDDMLDSLMWLPEVPEKGDFVLVKLHRSNWCLWKDRRIRRSDIERHMWVVGELVHHSVRRSARRVWKSGRAGRVVLEVLWISWGMRVACRMRCDYDSIMVATPEMKLRLEWVKLAGGL